MIKPQKVISFADRLKLARLQMGARLGREVRQKDIASELDVTESAYSQWENGIKEPRERTTYERLAVILNVDPGWLTFGEPDPRAKGTRVTTKRVGVEKRRGA